MERMFTINAEELQARPFVPPTFLVEGLIPQGVSLLCGPSKCGKSWLVLWMAQNVSLLLSFLLSRFFFYF